MKKIVFIFLLLFCKSFYAQNNVVFKQKYLPNSKYILTSENSQKMEMIFLGDKDMMEAIKEKNGSNKMLMDSKTLINTVQTTGQEKNAKIPFSILYKNVKTIQKIGNQESEQENPLLGSTIIGNYYDGNKIKVTEIKGYNADENLKKMIVDMLEKGNLNLDFPLKPMQIGDEFTQKTPFEMPIPNMKTKLEIVTVYKLVKIDTNEAFFDVVQKISMDTDNASADLTCTGSGKGTMIFNHIKNYMKNFNVDFDMQFKMKMDATVISATSKAISKTNIILQ